MIRSVLVLFLLVAAFVINPILAQERILTTSETSRSTSIQGFARDFWFSPLQINGEGEGKFYEAYISSLNPTTVFIAIGKATAQKFPIGAQEVLVFRIPLAWEMSESGSIEDKAIHIWSNDADLTVNLLARSTASAGGMTAVPVSSWGKEYVIAAYASYAYYASTDHPSEFAIVASEDNTAVTITPTIELREGKSSGVAHQRSKPFTINLNRGQSVMYQASLANGDEEFDVTGTIITSTKPIGVQSGVMCANVPTMTPACDNLAEMLLPVDRWGKQYFTAPFAKRVGGDGFMVVASQDNTTITRASRSGTRVHAVLNKYEPYIQFGIEEASQWTSDRPFMLVQFMLGEDWPTQGQNAQIGAPAMVMIPPTGLYEKKMIFHTPKISAGSDQYANYLHIIVHKDAVNSTRLDGQNVMGNLTAFALPGTDHIIYRASNLQPGSHTITSDSGVGVYAYGYASYEAWAWPGPMGAFVSSKTDSIAPDFTSVKEDCYKINVSIADPGDQAIGQLQQSVDTISNATITSMRFMGADRDSLSYEFRVVDSSQAAFAQLRVVDGAGNRRSVLHSYSPNLPSMPEGVYVITLPPDKQQLFALPLTSGMSTPLTNIEAKMKRNTQFQVFNAPSSLAAGQTDSIRFYYLQPSIHTHRDTLVVTADCWRHEIALRGASTPVTGFWLRDTVLEFNKVVVRNARTRSTQVINIGTESFTLDSVIVEPNPDFELVQLPLPEQVTMYDTAAFSFRFSPTSLGPKQGWATVYTSLGTGRIRLVGEGRPSAGVRQESATAEIEIYPSPASDLLTISLSEAYSRAGFEVRILSVEGKEVSKSTIPAQNEGLFKLDIRSLSNATYLLEISSAKGAALRGKFTVLR